MILPKHILKKVISYTKKCQYTTLRLSEREYKLCKVHQARLIEIVNEYYHVLNYKYLSYIHETKEYKISEILSTLEYLNKKHGSDVFVVGQPCCNGTGFAIIQN